MNHRGFVAAMKFLVLLFLLTGCATCEPLVIPAHLQVMLDGLHTPEMEAAIAAAKPGVPR